MALDEKAGLCCQKCRTPIYIDPSVEQLNPAAFKLLTDSTVQGQQHVAKHTPRPSRPTYPSARNETYNAALQSARNPTIKRSASHSHAKSPQQGAQNPAMSFINVHMSESMLDPPNPPPLRTRPSERNPSAEEKVPSTPEPKRRASTSANSGAVGGGSLADGLETTNRVFEILSARSDIDHPVCVECTELLVEGLQKRLTMATRERDAYVDYLRRANSDVPSAEEIKAANAALEAAKKAEAAAIEELEQLEQEKADLDAEVAALEAESRELDEQENDFWKGRNEFSATLAAFQKDRDALAARYAHDSRVLMQLQRRSVYNDTFNITHDNHFATINGLRLGRLPSPYVDWPEINAAWGQTCLLLATLAERLSFKFQGYELSPMGSTSTIIKFEAKTPTDATARSTSSAASSTAGRQRLELYSSGEFPLNFGFLHRKFDNAMVAFLECLRQLGEFVENQGGGAPAASSAGGSGARGGGAGAAAAAGGGGGMKMPYEIKRDKIHDQSIKLAMNKEEAWTKACKYTLTCCKYLLAHANNVESQGLRRGR